MPTFDYSSVVRATRDDGIRMYYTGRAGSGFVSEDRSEAMPYTLKGANRCVRTLNLATELHGFKFDAVSANAPPNAQNAN